MKVTVIDKIYPKIVDFNKKELIRDDYASMGCTARCLSSKKKFQDWSFLA